MAGIGVVTNPRSRKNRRNPVMAETLAYVLGERDHFSAPTSLEALAETARRFRDHEIDVLCVNGGDGTIHQVMTAMVRAYAGSPLPEIAILRGGTMNIVAESMGNRIRPEEMLEQVVSSYHGSTPLPETQLRLLEVDLDDGNPPLYGFISGNGIIPRFLERYYDRPDPSPVDAAWLLFRAALSAVVGGNLARTLTEPTAGTIQLDGTPWPHEEWIAVAIGSVEQIGLGFPVFHRVSAHPDHFQVVGVGSSVATLALGLPRLYRGRGIGGENNFTDVAQEVVLQGPPNEPMTIDGDLYHTPSGRIRYTVGPQITVRLPRPRLQTR
ncbi:MAG: diacylglycerol kinase family protein [Myxococcota bacterium]